ncbi:transcriptional regulator [Paracidovorax wautersii]|uniref:transcriptional regulator n=1 Tax=Paracidovorax wautersii TaxID=1177982 RepID=UPI000B825726|nr:YdaS family helix-turn-helix protein [Paracidovorax wautersii]
MNLGEYFRLGGRSRADLAACVGVSPSYLYQMEKGMRPVSPARALAIERATEGAVGRPDLRPKDWRDIWPELAEQGAVAGVSNALEVAHG